MRCLVVSGALCGHTQGGLCWCAGSCPVAGPRGRAHGSRHTNMYPCAAWLACSRCMAQPCMLTWRCLLLPCSVEAWAVWWWVVKTILAVCGSVRVDARWCMYSGNLRGLLEASAGWGVVRFGGDKVRDGFGEGARLVMQMPLVGRQASLACDPQAKLWGKGVIIQVAVPEVVLGVFNRHTAVGTHPATHASSCCCAAQHCVRVLGFRAWAQPQPSPESSTLLLLLLPPSLWCACVA